jgi:ferredoxin
MASEKETKDPYLERIRQLEPKQIRPALAEFKRLLDHSAAANLQTCVSCGLCAETCHYFQATKEVEAIPAYKLRLVISVFKKLSTSLGGLSKASRNGRIRFSGAARCAGGVRSTAPWELTSRA